MQWLLLANHGITAITMCFLNCGNSSFTTVSLFLVKGCVCLPLEILCSHCAGHVKTCFSSNTHWPELTFRFIILTWCKFGCWWLPPVKDEERVSSVQFCFHVCMFLFNTLFYNHLIPFGCLFASSSSYYYIFIDSGHRQLYIKSLVIMAVKRNEIFQIKVQ